MDNLTGRSLKGYELLERIGSGGFGAVYRAYQATIGREVAVKVILPHFANRPDFIRRFEAEAQLVARLEHLHIVPLYDYWREPNGAYLVMRWLRGGSAEEALEQGPFGLESAARLLDQVSAALSTAHTAAVVHRDLKPSNILLDEEGNAYLADFGIAVDLRREVRRDRFGNAVSGTPHYLAPEQARHEPVTPQSDIYSLGVTLYELLAGAPPFPDLNSVELLYKQINEPLPEPKAVPDEVRAEVNAVIQQATAKDPRQRYDDALTLAAAFRRAARLKEREAQEAAELLTSREKEVLELITQGLTNRQIAQELHVEHSTVKWHIRQIYSKLDVRGRKQAIAKAREMSLDESRATAAETETASGVSSSASLALPTLVNPYKGLRAFAPADRNDFYGRETLLAQLLERLRLPPAARTQSATPGTGRFLAVVGPSGSGKSSLVRAGLIPALWDGRLLGSERWFVVELTPGARPLDELEVAFIRVAADQAANLRQQLLRDAHGLLRASELILPRDDSELLLVIDQFEELFSLTDDEAKRAFFLELLATAVIDPRTRVRVVITLRADYYDRPLHYPDFGQLLREHMETVLPLKVEELEQAIVRPAAALGVGFEPGLVAAIIDDVLYQPGALPLLQYALTELFDERQEHTLTHQAYQAIGGTTGALARRAEELYLEQDAVGREAIRQLFLRLVEVGREDEAQADARRRVPQAELLALGADEDLLDELIDLFAAYRLLTLDHDPASRRPTVEVAHEALLREWERLGRWLDESRTDLRLRRQLSRATEEWGQAGEDPSFLLRGTRLAQFEAWSQETDLILSRAERNYLQASIVRRDERAAAEAVRQAREAKLERRARRVLQALVVVLLLAALVSGWFGWNASRNLANSESQRLAAEATNVLQRGGSAELAALLALQGLKAHYTPQADLALQQAATAPVAIALIEAPGAPFWPLVSPDNRYLRFVTHEFDGSDSPILELWDLQAMKRLWRVRGFVMLGRAWGAIRDFTADYSGMLAATWSNPRAETELVLLDKQGGERVLTLEGYDSELMVFTLSADGKLVFASEGDGDVHVWVARTGEQIHRFSVGGEGYTQFDSDKALLVALSPNGRQMAVRGHDGTQIWDLESGARLHRFEHEHEGLFPPQFVDDGRLLATAIMPRLSLWDLTTGTEVEHKIPDKGAATEGGVLSPDGRFYARLEAGVTGRTIVLWEVATGRELHHLTGHSGVAGPMGFLDGGRQIVTWGDEGTARVWDVASGQELLVLAGHTDAISDATLSLDKRFLVTTGQDSAVRIWDLQAPFRQDFRLTGVRNVVYRSSDGRIVLTADPESGEAILLNTDSWTMLHQLDFTLETLRDGWTIATPPFSSDGTLVLGIKNQVKDQGVILVYEVASGELVGQYANPDGQYRYAAFVPGSRRIFAGGDRGAYLLDAETGDQMHVFEAPPNLAFSPLSGLVAVSPDGRYGAFQADTPESLITVYLWNLKTGNLEFESTPHPNDAALAFAFSEDSRFFAWGGTENEARVLDLHSGEEVIRLSHQDSVHGLAFASNNRLLLTSTGGDGVLVWDLKSGELVRRFAAGTGHAGYVDFVENDTAVLYATLEDGLIHRQPLSVDDLIESACARVLRDLTSAQRQLYSLNDSPTCPKFAGR